MCYWAGVVRKVMGVQAGSGVGLGLGGFGPELVMGRVSVRV